MMRLRPDPDHPGRFRLVHQPSLEERFLLELTLRLDDDAHRRQAVVLGYHAEHRAIAREAAQDLERRGRRLPPGVRARPAPRRRRA